jgi:hypothetical protein
MMSEHVAVVMGMILSCVAIEGFSKRIEHHQTV